MKRLSSELKAFFFEPPAPAGLVYDVEGMTRFAGESGKALKSQTLSLAVKSFPHASSVQKLLTHLAAADVSNLSEYRLLGSHPKREDFTLWLTRCPIPDLVAILREEHSCRVIYTLEDPRDLPALRDLKKKHGLELALRIRSTDLLSPDHPLRGTSRFGLPLGVGTDLLRKHPDEFAAIHLHHGSQQNDRSLFGEFQKALARAFSEFSSLEFNLGGGWDLHDQDLLREVAASALRLTLEPGRAFSEDFGHAFFRIERLEGSSEGSHLHGSLSPALSLRWVQNHRLSVVPGSGVRIPAPKPWILEGPTCFEGDRMVLAEGGIETSLAEGDVVVISHVSGYSLAWNGSFNGISVPVYFLGADHD